MNKGDIIVVPFPFTDLSNAKVRPAYVLSNTIYNKHKNCIVAAISTKPGIEHFAIPICAKNIKNGVLNKDSYIRLQNIFTIEKRCVLKKVAELDHDTANQIQTKLASYFE